MLRAFAVLIVLVQHWGPWKFSSPFFTSILHTFLPDGLFGVDLFFVLSGYLITRILINAKFEENSSSNAQIIKAFYMRRLLRIFPIYYLFVLVLVIFNVAYIRENLFYFFTYTSNFLALRNGGVDNMDHTWSLAVEEQFYLIWPLVILYVPKKHLLKIIILFFSIGILSSYLFYSLFGKVFYTITSTCFIAFALGSLLAYIQIMPEHYKKFTLFLKISLLICIPIFFLNQLGSPILLFRLVNSIISLGLIVYVVNMRYNKITAFVLRNSFLMYIGKISYGIYLYHYYIPTFYTKILAKANELFHLNKSTVDILRYPPLRYIISLAFLLALSHLSFHYFESVFTKLKSRFNYNKPKKFITQNA